MPDPLRALAAKLAEAVLRLHGRPTDQFHETCGCLVCQARALRAKLASEPEPMTDPIREAALRLAETVLRSVRSSTVTHEDCGCLTCQAASLLGTIAAQDSLAALAARPAPPGGTG
jgi:hypothetical protein